MFIYIYAYICVYIYKYMCLYICMNMYMLLYINAHVCICVFMCIYVHICTYSALNKITRPRIIGHIFSMYMLFITNESSKITIG